ncbi:MAG: hypothetical protein H7070_14740 [Saprospiraceae bacterium]|nr:hypothetical protein [Pyrinomonadaceae bacterium]
MGLFFAKNCSFGMRGVLLLCVLTGLLCSRGEGVQLLPFHDHDVEINASEYFDDSGPLHNDADSSENDDGLSRAKFQSSNSEPGPAVYVERSAYRPVIDSRTVHVLSFEFVFKHKYNPVSSHGGRAPPPILSL